MTSDLQPDQRLVASLFGTLKLTQMYGRAHDATDEALANLSAALREASDGHTEIELSVRGNRLQVNGRSMRAAECGSLALTFLAEGLLRRGIGSLRVQTDIDREELTRFVESFLEIDVGPAETADLLTREMERRGVLKVVIEKREDREDDPTIMEERRESAMRTYITGLRAFKDVLRFEGARSQAKVRRARRAVHGLVDRFLEDEAAVLTLAQIKGFDAKLFNHSLNVCIYSLAVGQKLGMTRRQLGELGMAALFHDLGKTVISDPGDGAECAPSRVTLQFQQVRAHPARGARLLLEAGTCHEGMLKAAITAYEHHSQFDRHGFPALDHEPHLYSRIVAIADCYEALTATSSYRDTPFTPHEAFKLLYAKAGSLFDPLLLKVFVNALGLYPVGTIVKLSSGEIAMVTEGPVDPANLKRPRARVVDQSGGAIPADSLLDLDERNDLGEHLRSVARVLAPHEVFQDFGGYVSAI